MRGRTPLKLSQRSVDVLSVTSGDRIFWDRELPGLGESLPMIGKLLGHAKMQTTARYAHLARDSVRESAARVAASIGADLALGAFAPPKPCDPRAAQ